jgi:hypothetical protein
MAGGRRDGEAAPQLAGRALVEGKEGVVEAADAAEARGHGDRGHGQTRVMQELFGEEHAAGLRNCQGRCADVLIEEAAELTLANAESFGEPFDGGTGTVECALRDTRHGTADGAGGAAPRGRLRRNLRTAAQAGAKAGLLGSSRGSKEAAVLAKRGASWADGATVDMSGGDGDEEAAVKARIARLQSAIADVWIEQNRIQHNRIRRSGIVGYGVHHFFSVHLRDA